MFQIVPAANQATMATAINPISSVMAGETITRRLAVGGAVPCADRTRRLHDLINVGYGSGHVGTMSQRRYVCIQLCKVEPSLRRHGRESQNDSLPIG
jgi:hypothetical protein